MFFLVIKGEFYKIKENKEEGLLNAKEHRKLTMKWQITGVEIKVSLVNKLILWGKV